MMLAWTKIVAAGTLLSVRYKKDIEKVTPNDVDGVTYGAIKLGKTVSGADYLQSINTVHAFGRKMALLLEEFDILVSPTLAEPPAKTGRFKPVNSDFLDYPVMAPMVFLPTHLTQRYSMHLVNQLCHYRFTGRPMICPLECILLLLMAMTKC